MPALSPLPSRLAAIVVLATFGAASSGCLSHEYRISRDELGRLAQLPPEARSQKVRVLQKIGARRAPPVTPGIPPGTAIPPGALPPPTDRLPVAHGPAYEPDPYDPDVFVHVGGDIVLPGPGHHGPPPPSIGRGSWRGPAPGPATGPAVPAPPVGASPSPPVASGAPVPARSLGTAPVAPVRAAPAGAGGGGSGGGLSLPSGGGGSDELVVYAVIAIAIATMAVVGLGATEGMRYDGEVALPPGQLVYLQRNGAEQPVPLHLLSPGDLAGVDEALVRDDEGYGLFRLGRAPLDRRGFAFKVDLGGMRTLDRDLMSGFASHIQLGYFPHRRFGLLAGASLAGLENRAGDLVSRHALTLEGQLFPLSWKRLHLGVTGHVGSGVVKRDGVHEFGAFTTGAGGLFEVALTTRLALFARWDWSRGRTDDARWSSAHSLSAGVAVY